MNAPAMMLGLAEKKDLPTAQRETATRTAERTAGSGGEGEGHVEQLMLSMLADDDAKLRALGCRGLARAAMRGSEKRIVDLGGVRALATQLHEQVSSIRPAAAGAADASDASAEGMGSELLFDALNAALNLSGARCAQPSLARHMLQPLVSLVFLSLIHI